jgi:outer membrane protein OmpA-like peptidoglycan-associated protein
MKYLSSIPMSAIVLATLSACTTMPPDKSPLERARIANQAARDNPQTVSMAASELQTADAALQRANQAQDSRAPAATVDHLAYLASQRAAIAQEAGRQKAAEQRVSEANTVRDRMQLENRTREADAARQNTLDAQEETRAAELRNRQLEERVKELNAKATPRGWVVTFGDVLFGSGQASLKPGGTRNIDKLVEFLQSYPQRNVLIEGFTDSTGGEDTNMALSERRSIAVRTALVDKGVDPGRIATRGYGESYPVAGNASASGRQLNRRVEIILSNETGMIPPR